MSFGRVRLYHRDKPQGEVFEDLESFDQAVGDGWVDFPSKIKEAAKITEVVALPEKASLPPPSIKTKKVPGRPRRK